MSQRHEPYCQLARRISSAPELSIYQLGVFARVLGLLSPITGSYDVTIAGLAGTPSSHHADAQKVRRALHELRRLGYLQFTVRERQRAPVRIRLGERGRLRLSVGFDAVTADFDTDNCIAPPDAAPLDVAPGAARGGVASASAFTSRKETKPFRARAREAES